MGVLFCQMLFKPVCAQGVSMHLETRGKQKQFPAARMEQMKKTCGNFPDQFIIAAYKTEIFRIFYYVGQKNNRVVRGVEFIEPGSDQGAVDRHDDNGVSAILYRLIDKGELTFGIVIGAGKNFHCDPEVFDLFSAFLNSGFDVIEIQIAVLDVQDNRNFDVALSVGESFGNGIWSLVPCHGGRGPQFRWKHLQVQQFF